MLLPVSISGESKSGPETVEVKAMLDCGAGGEAFIDQNYIRKQGWKTKELAEPLVAKNVDGTENKVGMIRRFVDITLNVLGRKTDLRCYVTGLGRQKLILGLPWLQHNNPDVDWTNGTLKWRTKGNRPGRFFNFLQLN